MRLGGLQPYPVASTTAVVSSNASALQLPSECSMRSRLVLSLLAVAACGGDASENASVSGDVPLHEEVSLQPGVTLDAGTRTVGPSGSGPSLSPGGGGELITASTGN